MLKILYFSIVTLIIYVLYLFHNDLYLDNNTKINQQHTYKTSENKQLNSFKTKTFLDIDNNDTKQKQIQYNIRTKIKQPKTKIDTKDSKQKEERSNKSIKILKKNRKYFSKKLKKNTVVGKNITKKMIENAKDQATKERLIDEYLYYQSLNNKNNEGIGLSDSEILEIINQDNLNKNLYNDTEVSKNQTKEEDIAKKLGINNNKDIEIDDNAYQKSLQAKYIDEDSLSDEEILNLIIEDSKE